MGNNYYLGLDLGTNSVGWSVTDGRYNVLKFRGKYMIGSHLYDEGTTAEERRIYRSSRRRLNRRNNRIKILKEIFSQEISKVDLGFYQRLEDSFFWNDDKKVNQTNSLFNDTDFKDKDYHSLYPTIYHLRSDLLHKDQKFDIRLLYLAINHIFKKRGHFLFSGKTINLSSNIEELFDDLNIFLDEFPGIDPAMETIKKDYYKDIIATLKDKSVTLTDRNRKIRELLNIKSSDPLAQLMQLLAGSKVDLRKIFPDLEESLKLDLDTDLEDFIIDHQEVLTTEMIDLLSNLKLIYDTVLFMDLLNDHSYISDAKVESYEDHRDDLKALKLVFKEYLSEDYNDFFRTNGKLYSAYVDNNKNPGPYARAYLTQEDINKQITKYLKKIDSKDLKVEELLEKASLGLLLPKQKTGDNSTIPNQLHRAELIKILDNQKKYHVFLEELDEDGYSNIDKIIATFDFRIPYYVGPLNDQHDIKEGGFAWIQKKSSEEIKPWNFEKVVDLRESAKRFINNMTNTCTYLVGEDVLPKDSLLYQEYEVLNEINNIKINGHRLSTKDKKMLYDKFFVERHIRGLSKKTLEDSLKSINALNDHDNLEGIDTKINSSLNSYHTFKKIIGEKVNNREMVEEIILWGSLYNDAKDMLKENIEEVYGHILNQEEIKKIVNIKYRDWGRLSKKLLTDLVPEPDKNRELKDVSIINALRENSLNIMELLSLNYGYAKLIEEENKKIFEQKTTREMIDESYASPSVKRTMYRTIDIVEEIEKIMGKAPSKVFVEMSRAPEDMGRTESRKSQLLSLYKSIKADKDWIRDIESKDEAYFRSRALFLYYTQMGKCMYTGENINIDHINNKSLYDIDHIYPRSKTKDDSVLNNLVLVTRKANKDKADKYPLNEVDQNWQKNMYGHWKFLLDKGLIREEKFNRLVRTKRFEAEELSGFISRQLVETRQSSKEVARILGEYFEKSTIVFTKAKNVSEFRHKFDLLKVRELNDLHHAEDAYLNIVVGNTYYTKFTLNPYNFIKKTGGPGARNYNLETLFDYEVQRNGSEAWDPNTDIKTVKREIENPWKQCSIYSYIETGELFDENIASKEKAGKGQGYFPIKLKDDRLKDLSRYGAYPKIKNSYFSLIEYVEKNKKTRRIITIPRYKKDSINTMDDITNYCQKALGIDSAKVLIPKIKKNSKFKIDGFYYYISSKTGDSFRYSPFVQLNLDNRSRVILRELIKIDRNLYSYMEEDLTDEVLLALYDKLLDKLENTIYKNRRASQLKLIKQGRNKFEGSDLKNKARMVISIINYMGRSIGGIDLTALGGSKSSGVININSKISNYDEFILINESPTALYSNQIDLLGEF